MPRTKVTKEAILEKCWYVLHRQGYYQTGLSTLAREVGLGKAGLLHHFGSKEGLMRAVMIFAAGRYASYVLAVAKEDLPLEQRLEKMLRRQNRLAKIEGRGCFFGNTVAETSQEGLFNEQIHYFFSAWEQTMTRVYAEVMKEQTARETAYLTLVEYQGAVVLYKLTRDETHLEQFVGRAIERLKHHHNAMV